MVSYRNKTGKEESKCEKEFLDVVVSLVDQSLITHSSLAVSCCIHAWPF